MDEGRTWTDAEGRKDGSEAGEGEGEGDADVGWIGADADTDADADADADVAVAVAVAVCVCECALRGGTQAAAEVRVSNMGVYVGTAGSGC